ncbi:MAG TPA: Spy/CpxP family protein refolding chaperone [Steroidobacteraceae bacterium]|nr:Spy/CpxP family protein refolding chaperone [Steroidobacteraceae bacterium]
MSRLRQIVPALCLAASLGGVAAYAATDPPAAPSADMPSARDHGRHGGALGEMGFVLHKLNLTEEQKGTIRSMMAGRKSELESLRSSIKSNHEALATTSPDDANYGALVAQAQKNAAQRITLMSTMWKQVYDTVLTDEQRKAIPGIVAAAQARRQERMEAWRARHPAPPAAAPDSAPAQ